MTPNPQSRPSTRHRAVAATRRSPLLVRSAVVMDTTRRPRAVAAASVTDLSIARHLPHLLLAAAFVAAVTLLSLPAVRLASASIGWIPLWLIGMPLASVAALQLSRRVAG